MTRNACMTTTVLLCLAICVAAQTPASDPIGEHFFAPEFVLQHANAISLTDEQRLTLKAEVTRATARITGLQLELADQTPRLVALIATERVDEEQVLAGVDRILAIEREIKRAHLSLAIHIKNLLRPEQQAKLEQLRGMPGKSAGR